MAYNNAIPQPTDIISNSQAQLLANFVAIDSGTTGTGIGFTVNHITMSDADHPGMHDLVEMPEVQSSDPTPDSDDYSAIYSKTGTTYAEPYFINNNVSASAIWYGGTGAGGITPTSASGSSNYLNLPNGIQFRWGTGTVAASGAASQITFGTAFTTACLNVQVSARGTSNGLLAVVDTSTAPTSTSFYARGANTPTNFYYFAIGY